MADEDKQQDSVRILIVDDHHLIRDAVGAALREIIGQDVRVFEAATAAEARQLADQLDARAESLRMQADNLESHRFVRSDLTSCL